MFAQGRSTFIVGLYLTSDSSTEYIFGLFMFNALPHTTIYPVCPAVPLHPPPNYDQDISRWNCSLNQRICMKTELEAIGVHP